MHLQVQRLRPTAVCAAILLAATPLAAHDFWLEPSSFTPGVSSPVTVRLRVGERLVGDPVARDPTHLKRFVLVGPEGESPVSGPDGVDPAGYVRVGQAGLYLLGYRSHHRFVALPAEKFESYLKEEGIEAVIEERRRRGESAAPGREIFSRCAKSLLRVGESGGGPFDRRLGFPLELVPEGDPSLLTTPAELAVRLFYDDRPLAGAQVVAITDQDRSRPFTLRTDQDGRAVLRLSRSGVWLVKAVHMIRLPAGGEADWESFWASLTFAAP